jgi:hypothetical protein
MRGTDHQQSGMFSYISAEQRVPSDHPLRTIRLMVDGVLRQLVACNIENDSKVCYQSACLEQLSDCRDPKLRNFVRECGRGCFAPVTCGGRG